MSSLPAFSLILLTLLIYILQILELPRYHLPPGLALERMDLWLQRSLIMDGQILHAIFGQSVQYFSIGFLEKKTILKLPDIDLLLTKRRMIFYQALSCS